MREVLIHIIATNVEGIFRLSGSEKRIKELRTIFDSPDRYGKGLDWAGYTVHDAANVLRRYLNQLPEPIVPLALYHQFREPLRGHTMQAVGDSEGTQLADHFDIGKAIATYQQLITELPPLNRQLLLYILDLLAVFASKSDENRMNSQNLAAIFQPGMLSHPDHDMAPPEYRLSQDVLIFLIENQDHFLIGMRGTGADEQTVNEVQNGTPPPGTPTGSRSGVRRSISNASAGADDVRKFGGVRRNISVSSRHSRQSNGAPSPGSPAYGTPTSGVHRSNTVPSKRSPAIPSSRLHRPSGSPSPNNGANTPRGQTTPNDTVEPTTNPDNSELTAAALKLPLPPNPPFASSQERLVPGTGEKQPQTPTREKTGFFSKSPTAESEKKAPNKLRKKRIPGSSNESAQSSTQSLDGHNAVGGSPIQSNATYGKDRDVDHAPLETIPSASPERNFKAPTSPSTVTPRPEHLQPQSRPQDVHHNSDQTLKPLASPTASLHSHSSFNDLSHSEADDVAAAEQKEKRSRWRLSRRREDSTSFGANLTPRKNFGSDGNAAASSSSIGSAARPRKSFTGESATIGSEGTLVNTQQSSNESGSAHGVEEKKGPLGWIKNKMREKREEREAERERNKSPPATSDRVGASFSSRGKSVEGKREEMPRSAPEQPSLPVQTSQSPVNQPPPVQPSPVLQSIDEISTSQTLPAQKRLSQQPQDHSASIFQEQQTPATEEQKSIVPKPEQSQSTSQQQPALHPHPKGADSLELPNEPKNHDVPQNEEQKSEEHSTTLKQPEASEVVSDQNKVNNV